MQPQNNSDNNDNTGINNKSALRPNKNKTFWIKAQVAKVRDKCQHDDENETKPMR